MRPVPLKVADGLTLGEKVSLRCERETSPRLSEDLKLVTLLARWPLLVRWLAYRHVPIHFLHPIELWSESSNAKRGGEGSQEPCCSNLFPLSTFHSSPGVWCHAPPFLILNIPLPLFHHIYFFPFPFVLLAAAREDAWFMKFYFYPYLRREKGRRVTKKRKSRIDEVNVKVSSKQRNDSRGDIHHPVTLRGWKHCLFETNGRDVQ